MANGVAEALEAKSREALGIRVLKFGGSSLRDAERIGRVAGLVSQAQGESVPIVVVSALEGTTNALIAAAEMAGRGDEGYEESIRAIEERHAGVLAEVASPAEFPELEVRLRAAFDELRRLARGAHLLREVTLRTRDRMLAFGEILSSILLAACLRASGIAARAVDARDLIRTDDRFGSARVQMGPSEALVRAALP